MKSLLVLPALVLLVLGTGAYGAGVPKTKNPYIPLVNERYKVLAIEKAMEALEKALDWPGNGPQELLWLELMRGVLHFQLEEPGKARSAFKRALLLDPQAKLPVAKPPTRLRELFEEARRELNLTGKPGAEAQTGATGDAVGTSNDRPPNARPVHAKPADAPLADARRPTAPAAGVQGSLVQDSPSPAPRPTLWVLGGGAALCAAGGVFLGMAGGVDAQLRSGTARVTSKDELDALVARGKTNQTLGWLLMSAGAVGLVGGAYMAFTPAPGVQVTVAPVQSGVGSVITGALP